MFSKIKKLLVFFLSLIILVVTFFIFFDFCHNGLFSRKIKQEINKNTEEENKLINFQDPQTKNFTWNYNGASFSIPETLYASAYSFYKNKPKVYRYDTPSPPDNWENDYFGMFLKIADNDETFSGLARDIREEGLKKKLDEDQIAELTLAFVQAIPYDDQRAGIILSASGNATDDQVLPKYPYETLYEQKGVCSDKSFLAVILLRELGYGTALFEYPEANHMAVGVECPQSYSTQDSGYCYAETTTSGHRIGIVPRLNESGGKAMQKKEISYFGENENGGGSGVPLENPRIYQSTQGKTYQEIINIFRIQQEMGRLEKYFPAKGSELKNLDTGVKSLEQQLADLKKKMDNLKDDGEYEKYNDLVPKYNGLVETYRKKVDNYNSQVKQYNANVAAYNKLLKEYSITE